MFDTDLFIIGGGPAGIALAIAARYRGMRVMVADGNRPPIDKACGEGLMPDSVAAAHRIGLVLPESEGFRFRGIRFHGEGHSVAADFPHGCGIGFRRTVLHGHLVEQAARAGVEMLWSTPITGIDSNAVTSNQRNFSTRWIVGADGAASRVRKWASLDRYSRNTRRFAYRQHFAVAPWTDLMEIYWGDGCQIYVTPVSAREVCVALISRAPELRLAQALPQFPALEARLAGTRSTSNERGAVTATARLKQVTRGNVALLGDASGGVDAITGEGLCQAFRQSEALVQALAAGDLAGYARVHRKLARRPAFMADFMLTMDRSRWIRQHALGAMEANPQCFAGLLAGHVGEAKLPRLLGAGISLGWQMMFS